MNTLITIRVIAGEQLILDRAFKLNADRQLTLGGRGDIAVPGWPAQVAVIRESDIDCVLAARTGDRLDVLFTRLELCGHPPFQADNAQQRISRTIREDSQLDSGYPSEVRSLLLGLLARDPAQRLGASEASGA